MGKRKKICLTSIFIIFIFVSFYNVHAQESREPDFRLSFAAKYFSRFVAYGIDLANESTAYGLSSSLNHSSGFYGDIYFTAPTDNDIKAQQIVLNAGYEKEFSDVFSISAEFSQYFFDSDSANILSEFSNAIFIGADFDFDIVGFGLSYDRFLGGDGASYFSLDISSFHEVGPVYILPLYQAVFMSQTVEGSVLHKGKGKKKTGSVSTSSIELSGLANSIFTVIAIYPATDNLSITFSPSLILGHNDDLTSESSQFVWNIGLRYRFKF